MITRSRNRIQPKPSAKARAQARAKAKAQATAKAAALATAQATVIPQIVLTTPKEEAFQSRRAIRIAMPDRLKSLLVDDWENVTKNLQLVQLPSTKPAGVVLDEYLMSQKDVRRRGSAEAEILEEVVQGLKEYFNKSLGRLLLYRFEREQFFDIHTRIEDPASDLAGKTFAEIYGAEHLLRLFGQFLPFDKQ